MIKYFSECFAAVKQWFRPVEDISVKHKIISDIAVMIFGVRYSDIRFENSADYDTDNIVVSISVSGTTDCLLQRRIDMHDELGIHNINVAIILDIADV